MTDKNEFNTNLSQDVTYEALSANAFEDEGGASVASDEAVEPATAPPAPEQEVAETPTESNGTTIAELKAQVKEAQQEGDGNRAFVLLSQIQKLREEEAK